MSTDEDPDKPWAYKPSILGINASLTKHGTSAENLERVLRMIERFGGTTECIHLVDFDIFPPAEGYPRDIKAAREVFINNDVRSLFQKLLGADAFILSVSVHWRFPASPAVAFLEKINALEDDGCMLEGKVAGIIVNNELEEGNVGSALVGAFSDMGLLVPPYGKVNTNFITKRTNRHRILEWLFERYSPTFRKEVDGTFKRLEALAENIIRAIAMLQESGANKREFWE